MTEECYRFIVAGRVQGVFFRQSAAGEARRLGLRGWVCNRPDGCVEGVARGELPALVQFRDWLRQGPPAARVDDLRWEPSDETPQGFEVRR